MGWMRDQTGEAPVLLFDEVLAELDRERRSYLLGRINDVEQAILTATDPEMFNGTFLEQAQTMQVEGGIVTEMSTGDKEVVNA
jgi:DNA replication and repair protein RecF